MPIVAVFEFSGEDIAKYHKVFEVGGAPILEQPQRLSHVCYRTEDGWTVVDVWQDEAAFAAFGEVIGRPPCSQASRPSSSSTRSWARSPRMGLARPTDPPCSATRPGGDTPVAAQVPRVRPGFAR